MSPAGFLALVALVMAAIVGVDVVLGARAEYLNAAAIVEALARWLTGAAAADGPPLFYGAARLAPGPRLALGVALWTAEALVIASLLALPFSLWRR
ncbi:MAG: hypothetical protein H6739_29045 [Alphaproteobacteria bacterium]|nr:hypothetical protein [Alphaproteobacteria bacterium]